MTGTQVLRELAARCDPANVAGMARFGIRSKKILGVPTPVPRAMAQRIGPDHGLAGRLRRSGISEARILASLIDVPDDVTVAQMEAWAADLDNWPSAATVRQDPLGLHNGPAVELCPEGDPRDLPARVNHRGPGADLGRNHTA